MTRSDASYERPSVSHGSESVMSRAQDSASDVVASGVIVSWGACAMADNSALAPVSPNLLCGVSPGRGTRIPQQPESPKQIASSSVQVRDHVAPGHVCRARQEEEMDVPDPLIERDRVNPLRR